MFSFFLSRRQQVISRYYEEVFITHCIDLSHVRVNYLVPMNRHPTSTHTVLTS